MIRCTPTIHTIGSPTHTIDKFCHRCCGSLVRATRSQMQINTKLKKKENTSALSFGWWMEMKPFHFSNLTDLDQAAFTIFFAHIIYSVFLLKAQISLLDAHQNIVISTTTTAVSRKWQQNRMENSRKYSHRPYYFIFAEEETSVWWSATANNSNKKFTLFFIRFSIFYGQVVHRIDRAGTHAT